MKIKLGIDIHGVIDDMPEFFSFLSDSIINNDGEVHIITGGHWSNKLEDQLISYKIRWTHKFSVYDYLIESGHKTIGEIKFPDGSVQKKFEGDVWDKIKGNYCRENDITLHIDDMSAYNDHFSTPFARLCINNKKEKISHKDLG